MIPQECHGNLTQTRVLSAIEHTHMYAMYRCLYVCIMNTFFANIYDITKGAFSSINNSSQTAFCETGMPQTTKQTDSHVDNIQ